MSRRTYPDSRAGAIALLADLSETTRRLAAEAVEDGTAEWTPDPHGPGVWTLVTIGESKPLVVTYNREGKFEVNDDLL